MIYSAENWPMGKDQDPAKELAGIKGKDDAEIGERLRGMEQKGLLLRKDGRFSGFDRQKALDIPGKAAGKAHPGRPAAGIA